MYMSKVQKKVKHHENIFLETFLQFLICGNLFENYNSGYDILELYNILVQIQFTTSKTKLDFQYSKLGIQVALQVAKQRKALDLRKLGNIREISNLGGHIAQCLVSLQELRLCQQQLKNMQKQIPNFSSPVQFYRIIPFCSKYFVRDCSLYSEGAAIKHQYHIS